jgi:hypothetical protein
MAHKEQPTEKKPKGHDVPVSKRGEFFSNLQRRARKPKRSPEADEPPTPPPIIDISP